MEIFIIHNLKVGDRNGKQFEEQTDIEGIVA
jgi:hypothetical protein